MVWEGFTTNGECDLFRIDGITNAEKYRQIMIHHPLYQTSVEIFFFFNDGGFC